MNKTEKAFLFDLLGTPSPTGWEARGQAKWAGYVREFADEVENDAYGNAWGVVRGNSGGPTVMLEAHADEIGFIVKFISNDGFLRVDRVGGIDHATARGRRVTILGDRGDVAGIIGNTAIHIRDRKNGGEKAPEVHELYIDVGAGNAREVAKLGIRVGHPAVYSDSAGEFGKGKIQGRALDNRLGGFIIAQTLRRLSKDKPTATVYAANCVHEEIGGLGSMMVAHRIMPDVCVVLDVTHATDSPDIKHAQHGKVKLGGGPSLTHGAANHVNVVQRLIEVSESHQIPIQHEAASRFTGTDADRIYHTREGIPTALVSLPLRYMHSVVEVADLKDVDHVVNLLAEFSLSVAKGDEFGVRL